MTETVRLSNLVSPRKGRLHRSSPRVPLGTLANRNRAQLQLEALEDRALLSVAPGLPAPTDTLSFIEPLQWAGVGSDNLSASLERSTALIGVTALRTDARFAGISGDGFNGSPAIGVAIVDTGIDVDRPALLHVAGGTNTQTLGGSFDDNNSHGTHVAGIVASNDPVHTGVAPGVNLYAVKVLNSAGSGSVANIANGLQWVIDNAAALNIKVVNMSLGDAGNYPADQGNFLFGSIHSRIDTLEAMGVTVVSAAGNSYFSFQSPGSSDPGSFSTLDVGAVWSANFGRAQWSSGAIDNTSGADRLVSFSQRDPNNPRFVLAPGAIITSTIPFEFDTDGTPDGFAGFAGTSMATPHVSGVVALMQDAAIQFGGRYLTPTEVVSILRSTAVTVFDGDNEDDNVTNTNRNYLRINAFAAVESVFDMFGGQPPVDTTDLGVTAISASPSVVTQGNSVTVSVTVRNVGNQNVTSDVTVTLTDDTTGTQIGSQTILGGLAAGTSAPPIVFTWNTTELTALGNHTLTASLSFADDNAANNTKSTTVLVNAPPPPLNDLLFFSVQTDGTVAGMNVANEDILTFDGTTYRRFFRGSDFNLGGPLGGFSIDAFTVVKNAGTTEIYLSFAEAGMIPGTSLGTIRDEDVVRFTVTAFAPDGSVSAGTWSMYFDGSDVGLSSSMFSTTTAEGKVDCTS